MDVFRTLGRRTSEAILRVVLETCPAGSGLQQIFDLDDPELTLESAFALIQSIQIEVTHLPDSNTEHKNLIIVLPEFPALSVVKTFLLRSRLFYNYGLKSNGGGLPLSIPVTFRVGSVNSPINLLIGETSAASVNLDGTVTVSAVGGSQTNLAAVATTGSFNDLLDVPSAFPPSPHGHGAGDITGLSAVATSGAYGDLSGRPIFPTGMNRFASARLGVTALTPLTNNQWNILPFVVGPTGTYDDIGLTFLNRAFRFPSWVRYAIISAHIFTDISTPQYMHLATGRIFWNFSAHGSAPPNSAASGLGYDANNISGCLRGNYGNFADQETGGRIYRVDPAADQVVDGAGSLHAHGAMGYVAGGARNLRNNGEVRLSVLAWGVV
jgi:hypothetical protein